MPIHGHVSILSINKESRLQQLIKELNAYTIAYINTIGIIICIVAGCSLRPSKFYFSVRVSASRLSGLQQLRYVIIICAAKLYDCESHKGSATSIHRAHSNFNQRIDLPFCTSPLVSKVIPASMYDSANKWCERNVL